MEHPRGEQHPSVTLARLVAVDQDDGRSGWIAGGNVPAAIATSGSRLGRVTDSNSGIAYGLVSTPSRLNDAGLFAAFIVLQPGLIADSRS